MNDKLNIRVILCERTYPLSVQPHEEETVRKAARQINDYYLKYQSSYPGLDAQDYLAMAALHFSRENLKVKSQIGDTKLAGALQSVEKQLDELIALA